MRVLIVEDETLLAESIKTLLERKGFTVELAYDGITGTAVMGWGCPSQRALPRSTAAAPGPKAAAGSTPYIWN